MTTESALSAAHGSRSRTLHCRNSSRRVSNSMGVFVMAVRAVLFDLGNTLVSYYRAEDFPIVLRSCVAACLAELDMPGSGIDEALFQRAMTLNIEASDHRVRPIADRLAVLFPCFACHPGRLERLTAAFLKPIFATAVMDPAVLPTLAALREQDVLTAIVSNTPWGSPAELWRQELARHGLLSAVDAAVFCVEVGFRKPHPAPIRQALVNLGVEPAEALFVGDDPRWDVAGARAAGVVPLLLAASADEAASDVISIDGIGLVSQCLRALGVIR